MVAGPPVGAGQEYGSGWVLDAHRGLVVTAFHVVNGQNTVQVRSQYISPNPQDATVVAASPCEDIALLQLVDGGGLRPLPLAPVKGLVVGERVEGMGWADQTWQRYVGTVRATRARLGERFRKPDQAALDDLLLTSNISDPGMSGGPVVFQDGRLVGMIASGNAKVGATASIRVDRIRQTLAAFRRGRAAGWLGGGIVPPGNPTERGLLVRGLPGISGEYPNRAVLVTDVDGRPVGNSFGSWCRAVKSLPPRRVRLTFITGSGEEPRSQRLAINSVQAGLP
jgi:S1-C subfamily serine protease